MNDPERPFVIDLPACPLLSTVWMREAREASITITHPQWDSSVTRSDLQSLRVAAGDSFHSDSEDEEKTGK